MSWLTKLIDRITGTRETWNVHCDRCGITLSTNDPDAGSAEFARHLHR